MKILITGATGFIGSHLIFELLKNKSNKIIATSKSTNKAMKFGWYSKVKYIEFDFNNYKDENLYSLFEKPDQIIHLAWNNLSDVKSPKHLNETLFNHYKFVGSTKMFEDFFPITWSKSKKKEYFIKKYLK